MRKLFVPIVAALLASAAPAFAEDQDAKPTIVLVHGAFAGASSWNGVVAGLERDGYTVIAVANPLRSLSTDADYVRRTVAALKAPVVLVGHSYGGSVISDAAANSDNVKALVFVAGFAQDVGESALQLSNKFPGGTLGTTLAAPVPLADGHKDLYIEREKFPTQFAADVPIAEARLMAATQRPVEDAALSEASTEAAWRTRPSWFIYGSADKNIPPAAQAWMAERAKSRRTVVVDGASHVVMVSHPGAVVDLIEAAAAQE